MLESGLKRVLDGFGVSSGAIMAKMPETATILKGHVFIHDGKLLAKAGVIGG